MIEELDAGVYSVQETATTSDHILDLREYHVELFPGKTSVITIENQKRPNLVVIKRDADTGEPIADTVFEVKGADGHSVDEIRTDANGRATLDNLLPGVYQITEKSVPADWLLDAPSQLVTLYPNRDHTVYFENHRKPSLTVNKVDSITGSPIKGAKFEVWYGSNNTTTGELNSLGTYYSDENGQFTLTRLRDGWYRVTELEPAAGFTIKEPATQDFYIKGGENKTITFENVPKNAIIVEKYDSVTGEALPGCTFQLRYLGGTSGTGGTVIGTKVTGKNGTAMWTGLNPGTYVLEEVDPGDGYSIIQSSETIFLADNGEQSVVTVRFYNAPDGSLLIRKVCAVNPSVTLQNAEFKVMYADGTLIGDSNGVYRSDENGEILITGLKPGKVVDQIVSDARGVAASKPLPLKRYQVKEVTAPAYWQVDGTVHDVTLEYPGQIIKLSAYDKPAELGVVVTKTGIKEVLAGNRMSYTFTIANTSNVALESFFFHDKIPYDVTSVSSITTGTYSQRLTYRILYKTNVNEYRVLASNLLTTNNYAFQLSGLPLMAGEVVTDIYFDFGTVPAGFQSVAKPTMTVSVSPTAVNGYQVINRADAGGQHGGTWQSANAAWITIVRNLTPVKKTTLPKTGY